MSDFHHRRMLERMRDPEFSEAYTSALEDEDVRRALGPRIDLRGGEIWRGPLIDQRYSRRYTEECRRRRERAELRAQAELASVIGGAWADAEPLVALDEQHLAALAHDRAVRVRAQLLEWAAYLSERWCAPAVVAEEAFAWLFEQVFARWDVDGGSVEQAPPAVAYSPTGGWLERAEPRERSILGPPSAPYECSSGYCGWDPVSGDPHTCPDKAGSHAP